MNLLILAFIISSGTQQSNAANAEAPGIHVSHGHVSYANWEGWQQDEKRMAWWFENGW